MDLVINYQQEKKLEAEEYIQLLRESGLQFRPLDDLERMKTICDNSNLIVTARVDGKLVGAARSITDFVFCTYLSDLAVSKKFQHQGIGKKLIRATKELVPKTLLVLLSVEEAIDYYPKIGMTKYEHCFYLKREE